MLTNVYIEAKESPNGNYEIPLFINKQTINIKFDSGAAKTIISARFFIPLLMTNI